MLIRRESHYDNSDETKKRRERGRKKGSSVRRNSGYTWDKIWCTGGLRLMEQIRGIDDIKELENMKEKIKKAGSLEDVDIRILKG
jgi:hypothetical protein